MASKNEVMREIDSLPAEYWGEVLDFIGYIKQKQFKNIPETMLMSEGALARDWNSPEEDAAWANL
ncbi:hypothetical protein FACS1894191_8460 [Clostridia bacterium]|nr:hypothetical protein FACS1894191_8460 [Clostridia bacterium]